AGGLGEGDDGRVVAALEVAGRVADLGSERLGGARGDTRRTAREGEVIRRADGDREGGRVAREAGLGGGDCERAGGLAGDGERRDASTRSRGAEAADGARAGGLGEGDD